MGTASNPSKSAHRRLLLGFFSLRTRTRKAPPNGDDPSAANYAA